MGKTAAPLEEQLKEGGGFVYVGGSMDGETPEVLEDLCVKGCWIGVGWGRHEAAMSLERSCVSEYVTIHLCLNHSH